MTAQARTIDLATVLAQGSGLLVLVSPGTKQQLAERLDKYIFPGDQVWLFWLLCVHASFFVPSRATHIRSTLMCGAVAARRACSGCCWG